MNWAMAKNKVILVDADVISHFIATGRIDTLTTILAPHAVYVVDNVYKEATWHPTDPQRKAKVDAWMTRCKVSRIGFPYMNDHVKKEFFRLKKESPLLGEGERVITDAISLNKARFPVSDITHYTPTRDLSDF